MDKAGSALKPDSQKSTTEQLTDTVKGKADNAAGTMQSGMSLFSRRSTSSAIRPC